MSRPVAYRLALPSTAAAAAAVCTHDRCELVRDRYSASASRRAVSKLSDEQLDSAK